MTPAAAVPDPASLGLRGRHFLKEADFTPQEWVGLVDLAEALKAERASGSEIARLGGKTIALIFEKTSTRTRAAFEVAAFHQGAQTTYLDPAGSQIGHKESIADTARVLGRMYDAIEYRGAAHRNVELLAEHAGVPVMNGLTDDWHPTQMLADALTMREHAPRGPSGSAVPFGELTHAYVGDARNNTGHSILVSGALLGMDIRVVAPSGLQPAPEVVATAEQIAAQTGARVTVTDEIARGVRGADFLSTDIWVSMGEKQEAWDERVGLLRDYQVNAELMAATGKDVRFMHCLPAFHDLQTAVGREIYQRFGLEGLEVTDEVFESEASVVFGQAENRMHTIKAVLVALLS
ncbi:ornithine carbamoyltransferase [Bogoriella caseilytica]|uniref:Ornithine carbamoyltransferase n=1 Tax=Bogoriella caseilytica TaxID=56055 RepID=A0A3N2BG68_9MICO|nr:ornithine carbamoyltransferase [Bogoriella caseilytica]